MAFACGPFWDGLASYTKLEDHLHPLSRIFVCWKDVSDS